MDEFFTTAELVRLTGLTRQRLHQLASGGRVPFVMRGRARFYRRKIALSYFAQQIEAERVRDGQGELL